MAATFRAALLLLLLAVAILTLAQGLKLPSYLKGCSRNDPKLNECALNSARYFFKSSIPTTGDRKYRIPSLDPLFITRLGIVNSGLTLNYSDMTIVGLKDIDIKAVRIDLSKLRAAYDFVVPELQVESNYIIKGQILVVPVTGKGKTTMTWINSTATMTNEFQIAPLKNGKEHLEVKNFFIESELTGFKAHMDGLFGGDKRLGDHLNVFLNENWHDIVNEIKPSFNAALARVAEQIYNNIASLVPYNDLFPDNN